MAKLKHMVKFVQIYPLILAIIKHVGNAHSKEHIWSNLKFLILISHNSSRMGTRLELVRLHDALYGLIPMYYPV